MSHGFEGGFIAHCNIKILVASELSFNGFVLSAPPSVIVLGVSSECLAFASGAFDGLVGREDTLCIVTSETIIMMVHEENIIPSLVDYMVYGPVCAMIWEGDNAVATGRLMLGATHPKDFLPGTIRGDMCVDIGRNIIHGSDAVEAARI